MAERAAPRKDPLAILWAASHRNVLTKIADQMGVSPQFVSMCLHGRRRSKDGRIERKLRELGAPVKHG